MATAENVREQVTSTRPKCHVTQEVGVFWLCVSLKVVNPPARNKRTGRVGPKIQRTSPGRALKFRLVNSSGAQLAKG